MARGERDRFARNGAASAAAVLASGKNPNGTDYTMPVSGTVTSQPTGAPNLGNGQATAGAASGQLVAARATRRSVTVRNEHATDSIRIGAGTVSGANGFLLKAGESISLDTVAAVNGIRAGASDVTVSYIETYD